jgi:hypothetical protein
MRGLLSHKSLLSHFPRFGPWYSAYYAKREWWRSIGGSLQFSLPEMFHKRGVHGLKSRIKLQAQDFVARNGDAVGGKTVLPGVDLAQVDIAGAADDLKLLIDLTIIVVGMQPHADQSVTGVPVF